MTTLSLTTDGRVLYLPDEGDGEVLGHVLEDDDRCPPGLEAEWCALADAWLEATDEGQAELSLLRQEYEMSIGGFR